MKPNLARRQFLKRGLIFVPAAFAIRRTLAQSLSLNDGPFIAPVAATAGGIPSTNLVLQLESSSFDASGNGSNISTWSDLSGNGHDFTYQSNFGGTSIYINPTVDGATTLNAHKTASFTINGSNFSSLLASASRWLNNGATGLSSMVIAKWANDPPIPGSQPHGGAAMQFTFHNFADPNSHEPYTDGSFYENFASSTRVALGNPATALNTAFRKFKLVVSSTVYKAYIDAENFFTNNAFGTFSVNGGGTFNDSYTLGLSFANNANVYGFEGNIAAVYVWEKALSASEQTALDAYILAKWGI